MDLREESRWEEKIYQIERADPIVGGEFGINNVQARQLANRTQYLLWYFLSFHNADGRHFLKGTDLNTSSRIPENRFAFSSSTSGIHSSTEALRARYEAVLRAIDELSAGREAPASAMLKAMTLVWKYGGYGMDFCLFTPDFNFISKDENEYRVYRAAIGDDSIDVTNSTGLSVGGDYVLSFANSRIMPRIVTIKNVLETDRVLLTETMDFNIQGSADEESPTDAFLSRSNWVIDGAKASVMPDSMMLSREITALENYAYGILDIAHDEGCAGFTVKTRRIIDGVPTEWVEAEILGRVSKNGLDVSSWRFEAGAPVQLLVTAASSGTVDFMCVYPDPAAREPQFVRTPYISGPLQLERYGALYRDPFAKLVIVIDTDPDLSEGAMEVELTDIDLVNPVINVTNAVSTALEARGYEFIDGETYYWRARYYAQSGKASMWTPLASFTYER